MKIYCITGCTGAGKSTYVKDHAGNNDIIYDHDHVAAAVTGKKAHGELTDGQTRVVNRLRYDVIRAAKAAADNIDALWVIAAKPSQQLKDVLGDECEYINIDCTEEEAKEHVKNDDSREDKEKEYEKIKHYFEESEENRSMPEIREREYRAVTKPLSNVLAEGREKRIDTEYYVEGYATTFNEPYELFEYEDGTKVFEIIDRNALKGADLSDVIMQFDHCGRVYARNRNNTLLIEDDEHGIFIAADLSKTAGAKELYADIQADMINKMSWAFTIARGGEEWTEDKKNKSITRRITKIKKVYDVSAVSLPANNETEIAARSFGAWIDATKRQELLKRANLLKLKTY